MSAFSNSGSPQLFKFMYPDGGWADLVSANRPFLAMVPKEEAATALANGAVGQGPGSGIVHVWNYSNPQGVSMSYAASVAQQDSQLTGQQITTQLANMYGSVRLNSREIAASQNKMASYMSTKKLQFDAIIEQMALELDLALHRAGNGVIGTITGAGVASGLLANQIQLSGVTSVQQFQLGMRIQATATGVTGAPVDGSTPILTGGQAQVLTVATTYTGVSLQVILGLDNVTSFAVGNSIVRQGGALGFSATNPEGNIIGMGAWVPVNGISPTDLFIGQINRNKDVARLTGQRLAAAGRTYREGIQELAAIIHSFGGKPDTVLMNPIDWQKANIELQQGARYQEFTVGRSGFKALVIASPAGGDLRLMSDPNQDVGVVRVLTLSTWKLFHMGELIHTAMEDGLEIRKDAGTDSFAVLMRSWPQLVCFDPRANGVLTF